MLHKLLKELRLELGMSQQKFGEATLGMQPTVSDWERGGRVPTKAQFRAILKLAEGAPLLTAKLTEAWIDQ
jgi:transcriptional regulator with XRE-family HTH domain